MLSGYHIYFKFASNLAVVALGVELAIEMSRVIISSAGYFTRSDPACDQ